MECTQVRQAPQLVAPKPQTLNLINSWFLQVLGYVKSVGQGAFVSLAANLDGRVKLSQLADGFVAEPAARFPVGSLVRAKVLAVSGERCAAAAAASGAPSTSPPVAPHSACLQSPPLSCSSSQFRWHTARGSCLRGAREPFPWPAVR